MVTTAGQKARSFDFIFVALLFLLSGLSSLIYQVIWTRMLVFIFGSTTFATSTVLSVFMGGLAVGSFFAGRKADQMKNPFLWYGILEGVIGFYAIAAPFLFDMAVPIYKMLWQSMHLSVAPFSLLRFMVAAVILLPPTACMGATLPLLSKFVTTSLDVIGNRVGTLYAINTLGAVLGALAAGFFLLPSFGLHTTILIAGGINISLTLCVVALSKQWSGASEPASTGSESVATPSGTIESNAAPSEPASTTNESKPAPVEPAAESIAPPTEPVSTISADTDGDPKKIPLPVLMTMISFGVSGAIAMLYEVGWTRTLLMIIGSTTYAFSIMLSTFLIGIFLGSLVCAKFADRMKEPVIWFGIMEVCLCLAGLFGMALFNCVPYWNVLINRQYAVDPNAGMMIRFLFSGMVMVPITLGLGAIFPIAVKACTGDLEKVGRSVGTLYSINTLGAIIGAFAAGFIIIPAIGTEQALILASVANLVLGMAIIIPFGKLRGSIKVLAGLATALIAFWGLGQPVIWDPLLLLSSQKERRELSFTNKKSQVPSFSDWSALMHKAHEITFWKDGLCAHVAILQLANGKSALLTSGHVDASDDADMCNQALPPCYALLMRPVSPDICVIGWGSGVMNGYALQFPVKRMVSVEIEEAVFEASKVFHNVNLKPEEDKRTILEVNDGRNYLLATDEKFDVICSQPSNPWQAGVCNLFTQDSFQVCHDRLKPGGIFAMWFQQAEVSHENFQRVVSGLHKAFPHLLAFQTDHHNVCVLASDNELKLNLDELNTMLKLPTVASAMDKFHIDDCWDVAAEMVMSPAELDAISKDVPPNSDDMNHLEYDVSRTYEQTHFLIPNREWLDAHSGALWDAIDWGKMSEQEKSDHMAVIGERALKFWPPRAITWAEQSIKLHDNGYAHAVLGLAYCDQTDFAKALAEMDKAIALNPTEPKFLQARALIALQAGAPSIAIKDLNTVLQLDKTNKLARYRMAQIYCPLFTEDLAAKQAIKRLEKEQPAADAKKVLELAGDLVNDPAFVQRHPGVLLINGWALHEQGRNQDARKALDVYLSMNKEDFYAWRLQGTVLSELNQTMEAAWCWQQALRLGIEISNNLVRKADALADAKENEAALVVCGRALEFCPGSVPVRRLLIRLEQAGLSGASKAKLQPILQYSPHDQDRVNAAAQQQGQ